MGMNDEIFFSGKRYISAGSAAPSVDFTRDYVARLCREGKIEARRVGKQWYVEMESLKSFIVTQEYKRAKRNQVLARFRAKEDKDSPHSYLLAEGPAILQPALEKMRGMQDALDRTAATHTTDAMGSVKHLFNTPGGLAHAALQTAHIPVHTLTPLTELLHKVTALAFALMLTFGTYAAVDPSYAQFVTGSVQAHVHTALDTYHKATGGGFKAFADRAQSQVAAAAENPTGALISLSGAGRRVFLGTIELRKCLYLAYPR